MLTLEERLWRFDCVPDAPLPADEEAWKKRFVDKRNVIRRLAQEALEENERGETVPLRRSALIQSRVLDR